MLNLLKNISNDAKSLHLALVSNPALKEKVKDYMQVEGVKAGIRVGRLYTAMISDMRKIQKTLDMVHDNALYISYRLNEIKYDLLSYKDSNVGRVFEAILNDIEVDNKSESAKSMRRQIHEAFINVSKESLVNEFMKIGSVKKIEDTYNVLLSQVSAIEADSRECQSFNQDHLDLLRWKMTCCWEAKNKLQRLQEEEKKSSI